MSAYQNVAVGVHFEQISVKGVEPKASESRQANNETRNEECQYSFSKHESTAILFIAV